MGVVKVIKFGGEIAVIQNDSIRAIKLMIEGGYMPEAIDYFVKGEKVEVKNGPLKGLIGEVTRVDNNDRLLVRVDAIQHSVSVQIDAYLTNKFPIKITEDNLWINASVLPSKSLFTELKSLRKGEALLKEGDLIAFRNTTFDLEKLNAIDSNASFNAIKNLSDIFQLNSQEIKNDFNLMFPAKRLIWQGSHKELDKIKACNVQIGNHPIYIERGAKLNHAILNTTEGPIYLGKDAEIMEGSIVRGPFAMLDDSLLKMGAKIYGGTTLGPYCKVGGEVSNSVFFGYSSKAHDGFLGN